MNSAIPTSSDFASLTRLRSFHRLEMLSAKFARHTFPPHSHPTYVIEVVESGTDEFTCAHRTHHARAGDVVVINPGQIHTGRPHGPNPLAYRSLYPTPELMREIAARFANANDRPPSFTTPVVHDPPLASMILDAHRALDSTPDGRSAEIALLNALQTLIRRHAHSNPDYLYATYASPPIALAREYLNDNLEKNVSLRKLSEVCGLTPFHLVRVFRQHTGLPPRQYLLNARIERARELLRTRVPIADVAHRLGFADQSHFTRRFKRLVGVTPGRYPHT